MKYCPTTTSSMPAIAALALLVWNGSTILWLPGIASVAAIIIIHTLVNRFCIGKCESARNMPFIVKALISWAVFILLPTATVSYAAIGAVQWITLLATVPAGVLSDCVIHSNAQLKSKWQTYFFNVEMLLPYVWVSILSMAGLLPVTTIIIFLSIPMAIGYGKRPLEAWNGDSIILKDLYKKTGDFQITFTILFVLSLIIDKFI